jgi:hypothetical protein
MSASPYEPHIGLVVEGRGEIGALPVLLRLVLHGREDFREILGQPIPCHGKPNALRSGGIEGKVITASARPGCRAVLVVLDGEGDPVCRQGPELLSRAQQVVGKPVAVCLADTKFESWLMASKATLGLPGLERVSQGMDPVAAIKRALLPEKYAKPTWQPRLTARLDLGEARRASESLDRLCRYVDSLIRGAGL